MFAAHGKLLLTGEYFVLDGAVALAVPTRYGFLEVESTNLLGSNLDALFLRFYGSSGTGVSQTGSSAESVGHWGLG